MNTNLPLPIVLLTSVVAGIALTYSLIRLTIYFDKDEGKDYKYYLDKFKFKECLSIPYLAYGIYESPSKLFSDISFLNEGNVPICPLCLENKDSVVVMDNVSQFDIFDSFKSNRYYSYCICSECGSLLEVSLDDFVFIYTDIGL